MRGSARAAVARSRRRARPSTRRRRGPPPRATRSGAWCACCSSTSSASRASPRTATPRQCAIYCRGFLDRAARSAAAASRDATGYAGGAIAAYRELGDQAGAIGATARLGRYLIGATELNRALEVLSALVPEAESSGDEAVLAETLANLARADMRTGHADAAIAAADRALAIAERLDLDPVLAEAFNDKASALTQLGRLREAIALYEAGIASAMNGPDRSPELRCRNNVASAWTESDTVRATDMLEGSLALARALGDRIVHAWVVSLRCISSYSTGHDWDASLVEVRETMESSDGRADRLRLRATMGLIETARGEGIETLVAEVSGMVGDSTEPEDLVLLGVVRSDTALIRGDADAAFGHAWAAFENRTQDPIVPLNLALRAAIWSGDLARVRQAAPAFAAIPFGGPYSRSFMVHAAAAVAALGGHSSDALDGFRRARTTLLRLGVRFDAACFAVDAARLLPDEPEVRAWAEESRPLLEELRARPWLERLDRALAGGASRAPIAQRSMGVPTAER